MAKNSEIQNLIKSINNALLTVVTNNGKLLSLIEGQAKSVKPAKAIKTSVKKPATKAKGKGKKEGTYTDRIIGILKPAGAKGVHVSKISKALKIKTSGLNVWFYTVGKKVKNIKKVAPATFAYKA